MFTLASLHSIQTAAETAFVGGFCVVARGFLRVGTCAKRGFRHFPNLPEFGSVAER
jgi:hypothetical protein